MYELWDVKDNLIEKGYVEIVKSRSVDAGHEVVQVLSNAFEAQLGESREDYACQRRAAIRERSRGFECEDKASELGAR